MTSKLAKCIAVTLLVASGSGCVVLVPFIESDHRAEQDGHATSYAYPAESCTLENPIVHFFSPQPVGASARLDSYQGVRHPNEARAARVVSASRAARKVDHLEQLILQLRQGDEVIRTHAASDLGMLGERARTAVDELSYALKHDESKWVRRAAARSLGKIGSREAMPALQFALKDSNKFVAHSAQKSLQRLNGTAK